jgi:2,3-bisphosphoglycerate-independent phosphoglycerate mutase
MRMNLVTTAAGAMTSYACGHITTEESREIVGRLAEALDDATFGLFPGVAYRHIAVVRGHEELLDLAYTPPHDIPGGSIAPNLPRGHGAQLLIDFMDRARPLLAADPVNLARQAAGKLPATDVWLFWPGAAPVGMTPFSERRGVSAAMTSGVDLLNGLAVLFGIDRLAIAGITDGPDNDYAGQAEGGLGALADHDLVVIHVESPDEAGHAGDVAAKIAGIEAIDREVIARVLELDGDVRMLAMPDHPTPIALKTHVGEPVPFLLWGSGVEANGGRAFSESEAAATNLVLDPGRQVMDLLLG